MEKIVYRKFILDIFSFFLLTCISLCLIVWVIQAVNYLDFVSEDGHSFRVYFLYTLLSFPKIFSRISVFIFFISIIYILSKYDENNEILIFWSNGIKKIQLTNKLFKYSIIFLIFQLILTLIVVPKTQDKARSFIRDSNIDYFSSIVKSKSFVDVFSSLTFFIEKKNEDGSLKNIYIKEDYGKKNMDNPLDTRIIYAKSGAILEKGNKYYFVLQDGETIDINKNKSEKFKFSKSEFNLSKFSTKSILLPKIQEISSITLFKCIYTYLKYTNKAKFENLNCDDRTINKIAIELYKRVISPFYVLITSLIASILLYYSKYDSNYGKGKFFIFLFGMFVLIIGEMFKQYINIKELSSLFYLAFPFISIFSLYIFLYSKLGSNTKKIS